MGQKLCSSVPSEINVATLNFSGINTNPFEFNDGSKNFRTLNDNYIHIKNK